MAKQKSQWIMAVVLFSVLLACGLLVSPPAAQSAPAQSASTPARVLNIYNWDTETAPDLLAAFERQFNVKINYSTYANLEEMLANVEARPGYYDIVVPGDYMVAVMREKGLLTPLNKANIPNFKNVDPSFISPAFDPGNRYCAPYLWGTLGIGYNRKVIGRDISGWSDFFNSAYAGRVSLLADARYTLGIVLVYLGFSPNSTDKAEINQARDFLIDHSKHIAAYAPDTGQDLLSTGKVDLAFEWSGDIFQLMKVNPDIQYAIPREGTIMWIDSMCIPAGAPHKELAEVFINFILDAKAGAELANYVHDPSPNAAAIPGLL